MILLSISPPGILGSERDWQIRCRTWRDQSTECGHSSESLLQASEPPEKLYGILALILEPINHSEELTLGSKRIFKCLTVLQRTRLKAHEKLPKLGNLSS